LFGNDSLEEQYTVISSGNKNILMEPLLYLIRVVLMESIGKLEEREEREERLHDSKNGNDGR